LEQINGNHLVLTCTTCQRSLTDDQRVVWLESEREVEQMLDRLERVMFVPPGLTDPAGTLEALLILALRKLHSGHWLIARINELLRELSLQLSKPQLEVVYARRIVDFHQCLYGVAPVFNSNGDLIVTSVAPSTSAPVISTSTVASPSTATTPATVVAFSAPIISEPSNPRVLLTYAQAYEQLADALLHRGDRAAVNEALTHLQQSLHMHRIMVGTQHSDYIELAAKVDATRALLATLTKTSTLGLTMSSTSSLSSSSPLSSSISGTGGRAAQVSAGLCGNGNCGQPAVAMCMRCRRVSYCGHECQKKHWKAEHKALCTST
jgi:hypothetical protein